MATEVPETKGLCINIMYKDSTKVFNWNLS